MDATLYTGNGTSQTVTNSGGFKPDLFWIKDRSSNTSHRLQDTVRGVGNRLASDLSAAENADASSITAFNTNGFSLGTNVNYNGNTDAYVAWQWQAGGAVSAGNNTSGTITSTVSANQTAGFSVVTYTNAASGTVGHGLGVAPAMVIYKSRSAAYDWVVLHQSLTNMSGYYLKLNTTDAVGSGLGLGGNPTSSVIYTNSSIIGSGNPSLAYCFAQIAGFSQFGSYTGNGSTSGPFIYTNFRPKYIMIKRSDGNSNWLVEDTTRDPYNTANKVLYPSSTAVEDSSYGFINILSNGFQIVNTDAWDNFNGSNYIYACFAESPFKYANAR
jgi:hypothetical protein